MRRETAKAVELDCTHHKSLFFPSRRRGRRLGGRELRCQVPSLGIRCMSSPYLFLARREAKFRLGREFNRDGNLCPPAVSFFQQQQQLPYGHLQCCRSSVGVHPHPRVRGDRPSESPTWNTVNPLYCSRKVGCSTPQHDVDSHVGCAAHSVSPHTPCPDVGLIRSSHGQGRL